MRSTRGSGSVVFSVAIGKRQSAPLRDGWGVLKLRAGEIGRGSRVDAGE
jgi:hypothetical protein